MCPRFSFVIAWTEINKVNGFRESRDSYVKRKFIRCPRRRRRGFLSSLLTAAIKTDLKLPILP